MRITLIRHAEMKGDPFVCPERPASGHLSDEVGCRQAEATRDALAGRPFDLVWSSTYGRALQTAETIFGHRGIPIEAFHFLREWEPSDDVKRMKHDEFTAFMEAEATRYPEEQWKTNKGEGKYDMYARIIPPFLAELAKIGLHHRYGGFVPRDGGVEWESLAVVAHGGSLNVLMEYLLDVQIRPVPRFTFEHTGIAVLELIERARVLYPALVLPALHGLDGPSTAAK